MYGRYVILDRDIWVKGKGLPKAGVCLFREGEEVLAESTNGAQWYLRTFYKGKEIKVATIL